MFLIHLTRLFYQTSCGPKDLGEEQPAPSAIKLNAVNDWFERHWGIASTITSTELKDAKRKWDERKTTAPINETPNAEQAFFARLSDAAYERVMRWARSEPGVVEVRLGMTGAEGVAPNFQAAYGTGTTKSFHFPGASGDPSPYSDQWDTKKLTRPISVFRRKP